MSATSTEKKLSLVFEVSLWLKGLLALLEIIAGAVAWFAPPHLFLAFVLWVTRSEFAEDPTDPVATFVLRTAQHLSVGTQHFATAYLIAHGVIKVWIVTGLLRQRLWYFPVSIVVFGLLIGYQLYRYTSTHSFWMLIVTALDVVVVALTWHEFRYLGKRFG